MINIYYTNLRVNLNNYIFFIVFVIALKEDFRRKANVKFISQFFKSELVLLNNFCVVIVFCNIDLIFLGVFYHTLTKIVC